jgi:hypothetical protein
VVAVAAACGWERAEASWTNASDASATATAERMMCCLIATTSSLIKAYESE